MFFPRSAIKLSFDRYYGFVLYAIIIGYKPNKPEFIPILLVCSRCGYRVLFWNRDHAGQNRKNADVALASNRVALAQLAGPHVRDGYLPSHTRELAGIEGTISVGARNAS